MSQRKEALRRHVEQRHAETWPVLTALQRADFDRPVYAPEGEGWTVHQVVSHLADAEAGLLGQVQRLVAGLQTVPSGFDLQRWNRTAVRKRASVPVDELLDQIEEAHRQVLAFLDQLDEDALDFTGRHPSGIELTAEGFLRQIGDHRAEHVAAIRAAL